MFLWKSSAVALYARVSTVRDQSPELQLRELREYAQRRGWTVTAEYVDHGVRGSKHTCPQLNKLMTAAHRREFDAIVCWKIDRFGRSLKHLVNALAELDAYRVAIDANGVVMLRREGRSWAEVCRELNISKGSAQRAAAGFETQACAAD